VAVLLLLATPALLEVTQVLELQGVTQVLELLQEALEVTQVLELLQEALGVTQVLELLQEALGVIQGQELLQAVQGLIQVLEGTLALLLLLIQMWRTGSRQLIRITVAILTL